MANRSYLMNHSLCTAILAGEAEENCALGANYQVPILWIALFEPDDLTFVDVPFTNDDGDESIEKIPCLFTETSKAKKTYAGRRDWLVHALGVENSNTLEEWDTFLLAAVDKPRIQLDFVELWMMYDNGKDLELDLRDWLEGLKNQSGIGWDGLCNQANLNDPEVRRFGIRGFPWEATLPWA